MGKIKDIEVQGNRASAALSSYPKDKNCTGDTREDVTSLGGGYFIHPEPSAVKAKHKPIPLDRRVFLAKVRYAMKGGAVLNGPIIKWSLSAKSKYPCISPRQILTYHCMAKSGMASFVNINEVHKTQKYTFDHVYPNPVGVLHHLARCRKCEPCCQQRRYSWIQRTIVEADKCHRLWFVTLTSNPTHRQFIDRKAQYAAHRDRKIFARLKPEDQFLYRARSLRGEAALYLKRVRKGVGRKHNPKFRFLCVIEPHVDFNAHAHLLIFENEGKVFEKLLRQRWSKQGFAQAKLVHNNRSAIRYVSKYITKDFSGTIHASLKFGAVQTVE